LSATGSGAVQAKLAFERVSKAYNHVRGRPEGLAVQDVSLTIGKGRFVCLLGPSGCGKSTLLNMAAGFIKPTAGLILTDGVPISGPGADRGVVFQEYALFPWYTVLENVELGPRSKNVPKPQRQEIAERFLTMVGLIDHRHKYPKELSGGMRQRAAIARTLANEPPIILMDEPFGALDAQTREGLQDQLLEIWAATHITVVFVTHSLNEAVILADEIAILAAHPGRLVQIVRVDLRRPRSRTGADVVALVKDIYERRYISEESHAAG
jgi:NitT/TauT family transport system ATP-binding protein